MSDKEFRVRHGLVVGNNVLVANVTSNTVTIQGTINATSLQVNGTTIPSGTTSNLVFDTVNTAFNVANEEVFFHNVNSRTLKSLIRDLKDNRYTKIFSFIQD